MRPRVLVVDDSLTVRMDIGEALQSDLSFDDIRAFVKGDPDLIQRISYAHVEKDEIFDLPGVVSRKKQLIPYFASILREMKA